MPAASRCDTGRSSTVLQQSARLCLCLAGAALAQCQRALPSAVPSHHAHPDPRKRKRAAVNAAATAAAAAKAATVAQFIHSHMSNQIKSNQIKSNQIKSNQIKSNQIKSNHINDAAVQGRPTKDRQRTTQPTPQCDHTTHGQVRRPRRRPRRRGLRSTPRRGPRGHSQRRRRRQRAASPTWAP